MLSEQQQAVVIARTDDQVRLASEYFDQVFPKLPVLFDLSGRAAGMYRVRAGRREIRYNPFIFARYFDDNLAQTVPHEVAHYVADMLHGFRSIRPHGSEWKRVMELFGAEPRASCQYDLEGLPGRRYRRFDYRCQCREHSLTTVRHNKVRQNRMRYYCRDCGQPLVYMG